MQEKFDFGNLKRNIEKLDKDFRILSFIGNKGGIGKTSLVWNVGETLAKLGKHVLFLDFDYQCNLSQTFGIYSAENTVANIFQNRDVQPVNVKENIDLIPGFLNLDQIEIELVNKTTKNQILYMWMEDHVNLISQYDLVLIDCHPGFGLATKNAIAVSHSVFSPLTPSKYGYEAKFNLEIRMQQYREEEFDTRTRKSYITADLHFIVNKVAHNKNASKELIQGIQNELEETGITDVVAIVPEKELINTSTLTGVSIIEMELDDKYRKHKNFFEKFNKAVFDIYKAS